ncbi:hypothetical protein M0R72_18290 [Candidatus Pacearchaeota archaeon]|nr:hypothetical protein [Candidatus Pacearchaeota archaeon]
MQVTFNTRLEHDLAEQLQEYHELSGIPKVRIIDRALREYLDREAEVPPDIASTVADIVKMLQEVG